jgi:hypothetical protein
MFGDTFSDRAKANFDAALDFLRELLASDDVGAECERRRVALQQTPLRTSP